MERTGATELKVELPAGEFRAIRWSEGPYGLTEGGPAVFLHGLSGTADVWDATVQWLGDSRPRCFALDQRGHGGSVVPESGYGVRDYLDDLVSFVRYLGEEVRLVGHSMGGRVAMVAASRYPELFSSVVVVDIGPEAWKKNIEQTVDLLMSRPDEFPDHETALEVAKFLVSGRGDEAAERFVSERLIERPDGSYVWRTPLEPLIETVTRQRSKSYWQDWYNISVPLLLVRGKRTKELRDNVYQKMIWSVSDIWAVEIDDVGHNIPMAAPLDLAGILTEFWEELDSYYD